MDSILTSIKKHLGIAEHYDYFDPDIIMDINSVLAELTQIGVGPPEGFRINGKTETWAEFVGTDPRLSMVQSYVQLSVKLLFDPPQSSALADVFNRQIERLEWRLSVAVDPGEHENEEEIQNG